MSNAWNEGYFTDVGYTYGYYREINPVFQRFCLLLRGYASPQPGPKDNHCELGFGQGVSVNIHAAANPGCYVGTDFNPSQAAHAVGLAEAANSGAALYDDSFEQLLNRTDLPQFDTISLHGIWTWVSRENHKIIAEFARRHLKPGGIFYVSYNCFPGWSPAYPLRQLFALHDRFASTHHAAAERVGDALKFTEGLLDAGPRYLAAAPHLPERLKSIMQQDKNYVAHEYFNREWNCMYFTDVVDALAPAKLDYACTATPLDNVDAVNLGPDGLKFLKTIDHPLLREQARDYFVNQQFRKDLYVRGASRLSPGVQRELLLDTPFALLTPAADVPMKVTGALGEADLQQATYAPLLQALADNNLAPKTMRQLSQALPEIAFPALVQAITVLVSMGVVAPCQSEGVTKEVSKRCESLNRHLCGRARIGNEVQVLASPVTGGGVPVPRFHQLFMLARWGGKKQAAEWAEYAWEVLKGQGQRIVKEGKTLNTPEENLTELTAQAHDFANKRLPILRALQVA